MFKNVHFSPISMIAVIDYGMGNVRSIEKALDKINAEYLITRTPEGLDKATHILLPGVGHFELGMKNLETSGFVIALNEQVIKKKKPFLGICLGMQLLFKKSEEAPGIPGLGFIDGEVKKFKDIPYKIPHIGWNESRIKEGVKLFEGIENDTNFYFIHSYHATLSEDIPHATTDYGYDFVSAVEKGNILGTQFHPEKSQKKGLQILKNFVGHYDA